MLDYGCGYGRLLAELDALGHADVQGVEPSAALVARCRKENPGLRITRAESLPLPFAEASFDAALLFAVLTSVPQEEERERAVAELARLVRPGGVLYVSDVPLQTDEASIERYRTGEAETGVYGTFRMPDGGVFVHQRPEDFHALLERHGFAVAEERQDVTPTLHGGHERAAPDRGTARPLSCAEILEAEAAAIASGARTRGVSAVRRRRFAVRAEARGGAGREAVRMSRTRQPPPPEVRDATGPRRRVPASVRRLRWANDVRYLPGGPARRAPARPRRCPVTGARRRQALTRWTHLLLGGALLMPYYLLANVLVSFFVPTGNVFALPTVTWQIATPPDGARARGDHGAVAHDPAPGGHRRTGVVRHPRCRAGLRPRRVLGRARPRGRLVHPAPGGSAASSAASRWRHRPRP
ncbi:hypothetical protein GCM10020000_62260 [Streptomyces olivoverticillatus]